MASVQCKQTQTASGQPFYEALSQSQLTKLAFKMTHREFHRLRKEVVNPKVGIAENEVYKHIFCGGN